MVITIEELRRAARIPEGFDRHDARLIELEAAAVEYFERQTGYYWGPEQVDVQTVLPGTGTKKLWLSEWASAVSDVKWRYYEGGTETSIVDDSDGYVLSKDAGHTHGLLLVRKGGMVWEKDLEYVITFTRGYEETSAATLSSPAGVAAPEDIRRGVTGLVSWWFEQEIPVVVGTAAPEVPFHVGSIIEARAKRRV